VSFSRRRRVALGVTVVLAAVLTLLLVYVFPVLPFVPRSTADLKYSVIDVAGDPLVCTGWGVPNGAFTPERDYPRIVADAPTYASILRHKHMPPVALTADQIVIVYREWLKLEAVRLSWNGSGYDFEMTPDRIGGHPEALRNNLQGNVDLFGHVTHVRESADMSACPICLAANSPIATPTGPVPVSKIKVGMRVWSVSADGVGVEATVLETRTRLDAPGSRLVRMVLADGREITASPLHRIGDGRPVGWLKIGDEVNGVRIATLELVADPSGRTYDLLPSGTTGEYWVDGILVESTLFARRPSR